MNAVYNQIGTTYDTTRKADPGIVALLINLLKVNRSGFVLDIACGSGNYTAALAKENFNISGVDVSSVMLDHAKQKYVDLNFVQGDSARLPYLDSCFDGAICTLATHHFKNLAQAFQEAYRVIHRGKFVIFTYTPEQISQYWLRRYFPDMIARSAEIVKDIPTLTQMLLSAGFLKVQHQPYFVTHELQDLFLQAGKYRPELYFDPKIRAGISGFQLFCPEAELADGLAKLQKDIETGKIQQVIADHESKVGDYLFLVAEK